MKQSKERRAEEGTGKSDVKAGGVLVWRWKINGGLFTKFLNNKFLFHF